MEEPNNEAPAEEMAAVDVYHSINAIPRGTFFRYAKSGTLYFKMRDGSLRNVEKAAKRLAKKNAGSLDR